MTPIVWIWMIGLWIIAAALHEMKLISKHDGDELVINDEES